MNYVLLETQKLKERAGLIGENLPKHANFYSKADLESDFVALSGPKVARDKSRRISQVTVIKVKVF